MSFPRFLGGKREQGQSQFHFIPFIHQYEILPSILMLSPERERRGFEDVRVSRSSAAGAVDVVVPVVGAG